MSKQKFPFCFCIVYQDLLSDGARQQFKKFGQKSVLTSIQDEAKWWCFIIYLLKKIQKSLVQIIQPFLLIKTKQICLKTRHSSKLKTNLLVSLFIHLSKYPYRAIGYIQKNKRPFIFLTFSYFSLFFIEK